MWTLKRRERAYEYGKGQRREEKDRNGGKRTHDLLNTLSSVSLVTDRKLLELIEERLPSLRDVKDGTEVGGFGLVGLNNDGLKLPDEVHPENLESVFDHRRLVLVAKSASVADSLEDLGSARLLPAVGFLKSVGEVLDGRELLQAGEAGSESVYLIVFERDGFDVAVGG
jgi:hypothetical protein